MWGPAQQTALQAQRCGCGCEHGGIQTIAQLSDSTQFAFGLAAGLQLHHLNRSAPEGKERPGRNLGRTQLDKNGWDGAAGSSTSTDQSKAQVER